MCDPRDLTRRGASAAAGPRDHRRGHTPRSVPGGSTMHCSGRWIWWEKKIGDHPSYSSYLIHLRAQPLLRLSGSVAGAARSAGENSLLKESFRLQPDHRKNCVYPERALDLGNTGGNRANPSPTRAPDICAIPVISLTAVPQQQRDCEIIGADTLLGACPAGAQCIAADAGSDGKGR